MSRWLTDLTWTDFLTITLGFAFVYKLVFPKQQPIVRLSPNELRNVLEIQTRRKEFSAESWITSRQELPKVCGRLWQSERRLYVL